jgi:energy-coupling factor transport system substrate-specific component
MNIKKKGLTAKDLIVTGIFSVLLLFAAMFGGGPFATIPTLTFYFPIGAAVLAGPIFMLFVSKVPKQGALAIVGALLCALGTLTGMHWGMNFGFLICAIVAGIIAGIGNFQNPIFNLLAYITYCIGPMGTYFVFFFNRESWISFMLKKGTEQEYIDKMSEVASGGIILIMVVGTVIVATLSGLLGLRLMRKQFKKAGIAA